MPSTSGPPQVPFISTEEMRKVDRAMIEDYSILLIQMMENSSRELAHLARSRFLGGDPRVLEPPVLALDVPSGVDSATGTVFDPAVRAEATLALALPKAGLKSFAAREHVGELYLAGHQRPAGPVPAVHP